ncbi:MAG: response regulator transcription factor [Bacteroidales bacterium]|nr:response regulator transcription factor [Bacteroidales bacterium]
MSRKAKILYVEDDEALSYVTRENLELRGFEVDYANNGEDALSKSMENRYDICLLDVMLPKLDGYALATRIREKDDDVPIIFLTAKSAKEDKIQGLRLGADDYITKPFSIEELVLKIEVFLRRSQKSAPGKHQTVMKVGQYIFDYTSQQLKYNDQVAKLTFKENELLLFLIKSEGTVVRREDILEKLWNDNSYFAGRSLDVFISRLRKYLKNDTSIVLENIHGVGFRFTVGS